MTRSFEGTLARQKPIRRSGVLALVLGDQLDLNAPVLRDLDRERDVVLMAEVGEEAQHVPSHLQRTALFLSAMRHFALDLIKRKYRVRYVRLDDRRNTQHLETELSRAIRDLKTERVLVTQPGEHRVTQMIERACRSEESRLDVMPDESFSCSLEEFNEWASGQKSLVMEYFYRERRRVLGILIENGKPIGGRWNFDHENREAFRDPPEVPRPYRPREDAVTREVRELVTKTFPSAPGRNGTLRWPVTRAQARRALADFVEHRLPQFGTYEDAMWAGEPVLYHSALSSSLNVKLISPQECVQATLAAYERQAAPLNSVEGFVRQLIGWREFIRGVYFREGSEYSLRNELDQRGKLPPFFWTGETEMNCLRQCIGEVVENAYGHHIPRLMVIGNFALIAGVHPRAVHEWFLAMYVDAVEWVTAPNVIGMSQHADGGVVGTKPYAASGKYIQRMSNYCATCRYDPRKRSGENACPFNTLYWGFLIRHRQRFRKNQRMALSLRNVDRIDRGEQREIREEADLIRRACGID